MLSDLLRMPLSRRSNALWLVALTIAPLLSAMMIYLTPLVAVAVWSALTLRKRWAFLVLLLVALVGTMLPILTMREVLRSAHVLSALKSYFFLNSLAPTFFSILFLGASILIIRLFLRWLPRWGGVQIAIASAVAFAMILGLAPQMMETIPPRELTLSDTLSLLGLHGGWTAVVGLNIAWIAILTPVFLRLARPDRRDDALVSAT